MIRTQTKGSMKYKILIIEADVNCVYLTNVKYKKTNIGKKNCPVLA
jgi:hypothetical protein